MIYYPSISKNIRKEIYIYVFDKIDGTQIRAEWNKKKGFYKFATKNQLMDEKTPGFGQAISIIKNKYEKDISLLSDKNNWERLVCFFEYFGKSSFAGNHNFNDPMDVVLFDAAPNKQNILLPSDFIKYFGHLDVPALLYEGQISSDLIDKIKRSTLSGMTYEGCVCKGIDENKLVMFKIKSQVWLDKLKEYCKDNQSLFEQLA